MLKITGGLCLALLVTLAANTGAAAPARAAGDTIHHTMSIRIEPATHRINALDQITIPASLAKQDMVLRINSDLTVEQVMGEVALEALPGEEAGADVGIDRENDDPRAAVQITRYALRGAKSGQAITLTLKLSGVINNLIEELAQEYARGFSRSVGLIEERGVYLTGATYWVPMVEDTLITYEISVDLPVGWSSVSQGSRVAPQIKGERSLDGWRATTPTEEIYLIAAPFHVYTLPAGNVTAMAFLRTPDDALANKYLETTAQYLEMYRGLLGPYPYTKFALVENFWETGYGMPSFTLLGPQVIRFPFILHSSYPHELLHNWWGNGVFVDFDTGNWAEGLTAYMADHLVAEQRGQGGAYRRAILQRYTNYVDETSDFPIREFRSRHNAATEAVGYGKTAMTWNMLRVLVGDENFRRSFQRFYRQHKYANASFDDIRRAFEDVTGRDLKAFFAQWVARTGAPELRITKAAQKGGKLRLSLAQVQEGEVFSLLIDVAVFTADSVSSHRVEMSAKAQDFAIEVAGKVVRVEVDPEFNLFRRLHWAETPPSLGNAFGADQVVMILPSAAPPSLKARYQKLASIWTGSGDQLRVVMDSEIEALPGEGAIWILGAANRFYGVVEEALGDYDAEIGSGTVRFGETALPTGENSTIIALRNPANPHSVVVGITIHNDAAVAGLARKLPHYGKYSYLAFAGDAPDNSAKGEWPAVGSPLVAVLDADTQSSATLKSRPALAELAPVFDGRRMMAHVAFLAAPALHGRGVGEAGLVEAADYIAKSFAEYGLQPAGDDGGWYQRFEVPGPDGASVTVRNVVAVIPGKNAKLAGQSVVVTAHYDHLGHGWPGVREAFAGQVHPGADDNASGVAVMLELAKSLARSAPDRAIVFVATTAEESGLLGARHYVKTMQAYPARQAIGNLNLDTVGRAAEKFLVFGGASASEWRFIFLGITAVTGIETELVMQEIAASDHTAFAEVGVPAIHLFGAAHGDYHRPGDTADKIDISSLVKAASISKEVVEYLAARPEPLTSTLGAGTEAAPARPAAGGGGQRGGGRRVSTGTMPDFTWTGTGVKVSSVAGGSAGAKAG
ncbi:MAG: M20/M25/M40 family metallo-hydrolase, partial [Proteobacteria bacterium]|nr:M20/M25/M40 family metallo-hydrolase [Pseudomonadota bacterium]